MVDNTSNQSVASEYPTFLRAGISIVTPNKKAFSDSWALWADIFAAAANSGANTSGGLVYHESSVGACMPIISTLKDLVATGDRVLRIEGVFSGTLSFLFNVFAPADSGAKGGKWSATVAEAKAKGFTEPDPRDDLTGMDVARKTLILARLAGLEVQNTAAFPVQSLIPKGLESCKSGEEFMQRLPDYDGEMESIREKAEREEKVVRFVGSVDVLKKELKVGLETFARDSLIAGLRGADSLFSFYTERYGDRPLIVQGPGAGGALTAMGVTSDLIKVLERLQ